MLNLNHLYYFFTAAQHKTITHAAKTLGISQPSLTSQIKLLESQLNHPLFEKSGRNVFLTVEGERLLQLCKPIFESVFELERKVHHTDPFTHNKLRIGFTEQIEEMFIAELVSKTLLNEKLQLTAIREKKETLLNLLKNHELDLAFTTTATTEPDIEVIQHYRMPVGAYVSKKLHKKSVNKNWLEALNDPSIGLALPNEKIRLRNEVDDFLEKSKIKNSIRFESDSLCLLSRAVVDGAGIGFFPRPYMKEEEKDEKVICLSGKSALWHHSLYLSSHHQFEQTLAIQEMVGVIKGFFSEFE